MEQTGYPTYFLYIVLVAGLGLAIIRPYWAFLGTVAIFCMTDIYMASLTRTEFLGPFLNLYDLLFIIGLAAIFIDQTSPPLFIPRPVEWIFLVLVIGILQTALTNEINYEVLRAIRWAITLPLAIIIGANAVHNVSRAKLFLMALILGAAASSFHNLYTYKKLVNPTHNTTAIRLASGVHPMNLNFLVAASQRSFFPEAYLPWRVGWVVFLISCGFCVLIAQWRAVYISIILSIIILPLLLKQSHYLRRVLVITLVTVPMFLLVFKLALPSINPISVFQRLSLLENYIRPEKGIPEEDKPRWRQLHRDIEEWSKGNWLTGRGLSFNVFLPDATDKNIAWGHVAYSVYLSHLGILGLIIYAIYLPIQMFLAGKKLFLTDPDGMVSILGLLTIVSVVLISIISFMSTSYLSPMMHTTGFLYGTAWSLAYPPQEAPLKFAL
jgi:hypothetical protein